MLRPRRGRGGALPFGLMQGVLKLDKWQDWDQSTVIPAKFKGDYTQWDFPKAGKCSDHGYAHQYGGHFEHMFETPKGSQIFYDVTAKSCANGWAMGNVASTGPVPSHAPRPLPSPPPK